MAPPPPPLSLAKNSQCQPLWVLRQCRAWQLCRDPTWTCQRPMVAEVTGWAPSAPPPPPFPPPKTLSNDWKEMKRVFSASVKKLVMTTKPIRQHDRSSCVESLREHNESGCYGAAVYRRRDDRNELIQLNLRRIGQIILACATGFNVDNCWLGKKNIYIYNDRNLWIFSETLILNKAAKEKKGGRGRSRKQSAS